MATKMTRKKITPIADLGQIRVEKEGVDATISLIDFALTVYAITKDVLSDGKIRAFEILKYDEALFKLIKNAKHWSKIPSEVKDLSSAEIDMIKKYFIDNFELKDDKREKVIEFVVDKALEFAKIFV
jgi:hypothetical protein